MKDVSTGAILRFGLVAMICVIVWGIISNNIESSKKREAEQSQKAMEERQESEAKTYIDGVIEAFKSEGHVIDNRTIIGRCAYDNVVNKLKSIEKSKWTESDTKSKLLAEYETCKKEEDDKNKSSRQVTAHLACRHYAENYFFPYKVKFHNIAGVIYDAARGDNEWVYTLDITVQSAQGGEVRYNMDCVTSNFSYDNSSAEVIMFEVLPY